MKAVKKGLSLILSPNFFTKNENDMVVQFYFPQHYYKADRLSFVMVSWKVKLDNYIVFVFRTEVWQ